jgi:hypothetical protein
MNIRHRMLVGCFPVGLFLLFFAAVGETAYGVATPTFSPAAGTYTGGQSVIVNDTTSGVTIYYTTNGTTPTTSSTLYTGAITVSATETIKAIAVLSGTSSSVASAAYTIDAPPAPTFSPVAGTYTGGQSVTISDTTSGATFYYTTNGTTPTTSSTGYIGPVLVSASETIKAIAVLSGTTSPAGSAAYTIQAPATPTFSPAAGTYTSSESVTISDATSGVTILYTTNGTTPTTSSTKYTGAITVLATETIKAMAVLYETDSSVGTAAYTITEPATPAFSPGTGTYTSSQSVTISDATSGATIYYTTNGTTPTTSSTKYTGAITVSATEVVQAIASHTGLTSAVGSGSYSFGKTTATALASSLNPANYGSSVTFTVTVAPSAATGTVQFKNGGVNLGSAVTLSGGKATYATSLTPGTYSITATYSGNSTYTGSTSATLTETVNKATLIVAGPVIGFVQGQALPTFTPTYSGFVNGDTHTVLSGAPSFTTTATSSSPIGNAYAVTASLGTLSAANYAFSLQNGAVAVVAPPTDPLPLTFSASGSTETATLTLGQGEQITSVVGCTYSAAGISGSEGSFNLTVGSGGNSATGTFSTSALPAGFYTADCGVNANIQTPREILIFSPTSPSVINAFIEQGVSFSVGTGNCVVTPTGESIYSEVDTPPVLTVTWTANYTVSVGGQLVNGSQSDKLNGTGSTDCAGDDYLDCDGDEVCSDTGQPQLPTEMEGQTTYDTSGNPITAELGYEIQDWTLPLTPDSDCDCDGTRYLADPAPAKNGNPNPETVLVSCSTTQ